VPTNAALVGSDSGAYSANVIVPDTTPPETKIVSGPPKLTKKSKPKIVFSSNEIGATFQCKLDKQAYYGCVTPFRDQLTAGKHTFSVAALDRAGNLDPTPATRTFTVDLKAPKVKLKGGPKGKTTSTTATFKFKASEKRSKFACKLDKGKLKRCKPPQRYKHLRPGKHLFEIQATDKAGNKSKPLKRKWVVVKRAAHHH
jgi:hypothetical protein